MSDFDPRYHRSPKLPPNTKVAEVQAGPAAPTEATDFKGETFTRLKPATPIPDLREDFQKDAPPRPPAPDPFQEFSVEKTPLSGLMADLPSLDGLFRPFDLASENPITPEAYADLVIPGPPQTFAFEDLDTRDPDVIRTLGQAEEKGRENLAKAEEEAARIVDGGRTEARGLINEAEAQARAIADQARREAGDILAAAREAQSAADENAAAASEARAGAEAALAEAEAQLSAARERIAGLDQERQDLAAETEVQRQALVQEYDGLKAALEASRTETMNAARAEGREAGHAQGLTEGRAAGRAEALKAFQDQVEGLLAVIGKMEGLYNDLWTANGPMMIRLAIDAAEQILHKELREADDLAARAFEACIDFLSQAHRVTFLARPQDIAQLEKARADQRGRLGALVKVTFQPDETLGPGDLIMESDVGRLDATVKHRTAQVLRVLREAFAGTHGDLSAVTEAGTASPPSPPPPPAAAADPAPEPAPEPTPEPQAEPAPAAAPAPEPDPWPDPDPASASEADTWPEPEPAPAPETPPEPEKEKP